MGDLEERTSKITLSGSATTVRWLIANGLLDELQLLVAPIAIEPARAVPSLRVDHDAGQIVAIAW